MFSTPLLQPIFATFWNTHTRLFWRRAALAAAWAALCLAAPLAAQDNRLLYRGSTIVTGHSGTYMPLGGALPPGSTPDDETFLDPNGATARFFLPDHPGFIWDASEWNLAPYYEVFAGNVGQVFGIAIDRGWPLRADGSRPPPNAYLSATSAFGLNLVIADVDGDGLPERVRVGQPGATFMDAQFGNIPGAGPGSIYRIDGVTRQVTLLTNITLNGTENSGAALGNIAFDRVHDQLFVSDRDTGMIHRLDLNGAELGRFDHGVDARPNLGLPPVAFDPTNRLDPQGFAFDSEEPETWGYANEARRVWGLAVHGGRLYYSVARDESLMTGPQIWSVGIDATTGAFLADARWELDVNPDGPAFEVSDIVFNGADAMILAQRGTQLGSYDYSGFMKPRKAHLYRYWRETPDDPATQSRWQLIPQEYAIGFQPNCRNSSGGVDLNYGYDDTGNMDFGVCEGSIWTSGDNLRVNPQLTSQLLQSGNLLVHGVQGSPSDLVRPGNEPPFAAYFVDYDKLYDDPQASGHMGDVEVYHPCRGGGKIPPFVPPPFLPPPPPPPPNGQCIQIKKAVQCDQKTGQTDLTIWVFDGSAGLNPDTLKVTTPTPGISIAPGPVSPLNPGQFSILGGAPNQSVDLDLCAFRLADAQSGKPFTCCRLKTKVSLPPNRECRVREMPPTREDHPPVLQKIVE